MKRVGRYRIKERMMIVNQGTGYCCSRSMEEGSPRSAKGYELGLRRLKIVK